MKNAGATNLHSVHPGPCVPAAPKFCHFPQTVPHTSMPGQGKTDPFENDALDGCRGWGSCSCITAWHYAFIRVLEKTQGKRLQLFYCLRHFLQLLPFLRITNPSGDPAWPYLSCKSWQDHSLKQYSHRLNTSNQNVCLVFSRNVALKIYNTSL